MAGIDSNWQGAFVGAFIVLAVLLGMVTSGRSLTSLIGHSCRRSIARAVHCGQTVKNKREEMI
jgi:hypothetical protein